MATQYPVVKYLSKGGNWPSFSADGSTIVYVVGFAGGGDGGVLVTVPSAGGPSTVLFDSNQGVATRPDWSWSPHTIAFALQRGKAPNITNTLWLVESDGSNPRPVPNTSLGQTIYPYSGSPKLHSERS